MTSPVEEIQVECPRCRTVFKDWWRPSVNLDLDDFDDDYLRQATTAKCPSCGHVVAFDSLVVKGGVWRFPPVDAELVEPVALTEDRPRDPQVETEIAKVETALRERFGDDHDLLRPGVFRGSLWFQAAAWALDSKDDEGRRSE